MENRMKLSAITVVLTFLFGVMFAVNVNAEGSSSDNQYSGDFWSRSTLTGDWGGLRNDLASKGVTFDINLTQIGQSVVSGGKDIGWEYGGRGDITLNVDTGKLGLWPGGFLMLELEGNYGNSVNSDTGALMPVNTNQIFPIPGSDQLNLPALQFTQFLSPYFGVFVGKVATITSRSGDMNEFAHGKGDTQFFNTAFNVNPALLLTMPYSTLAGGMVILPTKNPEEAIVNILALDGDGLANRSGFDTLFKGNTAYAIEGRIKTNFFSMTGHQVLGATYSTKNFTSLNQSLRIIIPNLTIQEEDNSWSVYYNFDQYVYEPKKGQGIGIFGRFGASDGNPNPVHYFYSIGVGGKGIVPGRTKDEFGIGYYYIDVSSPKLVGLLGKTRSFLGNEQGFEAYYNFAITPWMKLTPDIQVVRGAQKNELDTAGGILNISKKSVDTATVIGLRLQVVF